jgi:photosystem II stability/assembly factor-like uncharacterized protein
MSRKPLISLIAILTIFLPCAPAQPLNDKLLSAIEYRNLGPFRAGAWISAIAVPEGAANAGAATFYVAARSGGIWKTTNHGTTFEPVFDKQDVYSMGALAVAPSNPEIVWAGTGDNSYTRSAYWGDGVYKTTDGGKTWRHMGLADSQHVTRIVVHPTNPEIVYVAAAGHLHTPNAERGVFKTADGGKTWKKVLFTGDRIGAVDLVIDRSNPEVLYAAMYECIRLPWALNDGGPGSGIYKTTDGGATWTRLENGLPTGAIGRIGIDIARSKPQTLYAVIDNRYPKGSGLMGGEVYRTDNAGASWHKVNPDNVDVSGKAGYSFNQIRVDPANPERVYITGIGMADSKDGGRTWRGTSWEGPRMMQRAFGDYRTLWIDPNDSKHLIVGSDGGVFQSYDGGETCDHHMNLKLGEMYAVSADMDQPYNVYAGLQDHENWKGPSNGRNGYVGIEDWVTVGEGDGMYTVADPADSRWVYTTGQFGDQARFDTKTRVRTRIAPKPAAGQPPLRYNWIAPIVLSPHDPNTLYTGAQVLFRSTDRGDHWQEISPDLTTNDPAKISKPGQSIQFCTITTISESPVTAGIIWVGTDDGKVQVTRDGGASWTDVTKNIAAAGGPEDVWTSRVYASRFAPGTAFVTKTGRRQDDFRPYVFKTTDFGATWTAIAHNLPERPVNVILEDTVKPNLLFVGTDLGVYVSNDGGARWAALKGNMPPAAVTDMVIQPRENDLVAGTYGRGMWIANIAALREATEDNLAQPAYLFEPQVKLRGPEGAAGNFRLYGDRIPVTENEPNGIVVRYYLQSAGHNIAVTLSDATGKVVREARGAPSKAGLNTAVLPAGTGGARRGASQPLAAGEYVVTLQADDTKLTRTVRVPVHPAEE